uniref:U55-Sparatoxin-Hju1b_1 n=1 Tax=Heteropoda jugulans TaxID=1358901 RepID=A0A4Q8KC74_9ARAC
MYKVILLLLVVVSVTLAQDCVPNYCHTVRCVPATSCPPGQILKRRDVDRCRCCDYCAIQEGESCENMSMNTVCDEGLECDEDDKVCRPKQ